MIEWASVWQSELYNNFASTKTNIKTEFVLGTWELCSKLLKIIEKCNVLIAPNGQILSSEILGTINMKCYLSGMPELKLGLKRSKSGDMISMTLGWPRMTLSR